MSSPDTKAAMAFIKFLREKEASIIGKMTEKRNECIAKLDENERRLISIIPKEILDMNAGEFLERHEADVDEILMGTKKFSNFHKVNAEVMNEIPDRNNERFFSPPKKSFKKVIIKKNK